MEAVEPKCPACGIEGIDHFASKRSNQRSRFRQPWFIVVYCGACGYVHEVLAKHIFSRTSAHVVMPTLSDRTDE